MRVVWTTLAAAVLLGVTLCLPQDPRFEDQWYLNRQDGPDLNTAKVWDQGYTGNGVRIAVVDQGLHSGVADLNVNSGLQKHMGGVSGNHGDNAASVAAARKNSQCGVGVAYDAEVVSVQFQYSTGGTPHFVPKATLASWMTDLATTRGVDVFTNSYGTSDTGSGSSAIDPAVASALADVSSRGRSGKGSLITWATGNGAVNEDSCAYDASVNSLYSVAVSGIGKNMKILRSSEYCSAVHAVVFSQIRSNTDSSSKIIAISNRQCVDDFSDSSVAAPMAAGVMALTLSANPALMWRDMHHIVARGTNVLDIDEQSAFATNTYGYKVSDKYGFGLMDACRMTELAKSWTSVPAVTTCTATATVVPGQLWGTYNLNLPSCGIRFVEHVMVSFHATYRSGVGGILLELEAPSAFQSVVLPGRPRDFHNTIDMTAKSLHYWGERAQGTWVAKVSRVPGYQPYPVTPTVNVSEVVSLSVTVYGMASDPFSGQPPIYNLSTGHPCHRTYTPTTAATTGTSIPTTSSPSRSNAPTTIPPLRTTTSGATGDSGLKTWHIVLIVLGVLLVVAVAIGVAVYLVHKKKSKEYRRTPTNRTPAVATVSEHVHHSTAVHPGSDFSNLGTPV